MDRRRRAHWMTSKDDSILEYLADVGSAEPQRVIYWNMTEQGLIDCHYRTIGRRLTKLVETGLVEIARGEGTNEDSYYRITPAGRDYLAGEYKPE